ncbi:MAG: 30S ribosomal protein S17 [Planctomycetota bacterium]
MTTNEQQERGTRKVMEGKVVSNAANKTITVEVERTTQHPLYRKTIRIRKKFYAHDENNEANVGDKVEIMGTRPLSKKKCWRLVRITEQAPQE